MHNLQCKVCGSAFEMPHFEWSAITARCLDCDNPGIRLVRGRAYNIIWSALSVFFWNKYGPYACTLKVWEAAEWSISIEQD